MTAMPSCIDQRYLKAMRPTVSDKPCDGTTDHRRSEMRYPLSRPIDFVSSLRKELCSPIKHFTTHYLGRVIVTAFLKRGTKKLS